MNRLSHRRIASYAAAQLGSGAKPRVVATALAAYLVATKQSQKVDSLLADIRYQFAYSHGVLQASVTSARPLAPDQKTSLSRSLMQHYGARRVELHEVVDPAVLGGVKIDTPDKTLDQTTRSRLQALQRMSI